jgi:ATP-dependent Clp protease ATP-binding subunit ClpE
MKIVGLMIDDVNKMLADRGLYINVTQPVQEKLVELGYDPTMGARPLRRVIQEQIEDRIADFVLDNPNVKNLEATLDDNDIKIITANVPSTSAAATPSADTPHQ